MKKEFSEAEKMLLLRVKITLLLLFLTLSLVRWSPYLYPLVTWPMYSQRTPELPGKEFSIVELHVYDEQDRVYHTNGFQLWHFDLAKGTGHKLLKRAFSAGDDIKKQEAQNYLSRFIQWRYAEVPVKKIEGWTTVWEVHPFENPPFYKDQPLRQVLLDSIILE